MRAERPFYLGGAARGTAFPCAMLGAGCDQFSIFSQVPCEEGIP